MSFDKPRNTIDELSDLRAQAPTRQALGSTARFFDGELPLMPGVTIPMRSMLVETAGTKILISPIGTQEESRAIGRGLTSVCAPSLLHHKFVQPVLERLQPRDLWGPPGYGDKLPEFERAKLFGRDEWPYYDVLDFAVVYGAPARNEVVFFHKSSRTLYTADLVFNISEPKGFLTPLTFRAMGIHKRFAVARMWKRWVEDKVAFRASIDRIFEWDFDRIVMAHGDIVPTNGRARLEAALRERDLF
ncbi:MAG: hypothetical protein ABI867_09135 [Kofleriaceae bacterium]